MRIQRLKEEQRQKEKGTAPAPPRLETMQEFLPPPANLFAPPKEEENKVGSKRKTEEKKKTEKKSKKKEKAVKKKDKKKDKKDKKKKKTRKARRRRKNLTVRLQIRLTVLALDGFTAWQKPWRIAAGKAPQLKSCRCSGDSLLSQREVQGLTSIICRHHCSQRDLAKHA